MSDLERNKSPGSSRFTVLVAILAATVTILAGLLIYQKLVKDASPPSLSLSLSAYDYLKRQKEKRAEALRHIQEEERVRNALGDYNDFMLTVVNKDGKADRNLSAAFALLYKDGLWGITDAHVAYQWKPPFLVAHRDVFYRIEYSEIRDSGRTDVVIFPLPEDLAGRVRPLSLAAENNVSPGDLLILTCNPRQTSFPYRAAVVADPADHPLLRDQMLKFPHLLEKNAASFYSGGMWSGCSGGPLLRLRGSTIEVVGVATEGIMLDSRTGFYGFATHLTVLRKAIDALLQRKTRSGSLP